MNPDPTPSTTQPAAAAALAALAACARRRPPATQPGAARHDRRCQLPWSRCGERQAARRARRGRHRLAPAPPSDAEGRRRVRERARREQAGVRLLGREVVPAVQPGQGDALQPPGLHRALARLRPGLRRRRQPGRAEDRRALQGQRLSDDGAVQPAGPGGDAACPARSTPVRYTEVLHARHERGAAGQRGARRCAREAGVARPNDWRLLAFYSWDTDHQQMVAEDELPATCCALADAAPPAAADAPMRLRLKALRRGRREDAARRSTRRPQRRGRRAARRPGADARADRHADQLRGRDRARAEREGIGRAARRSLAGLRRARCKRLEARHDACRAPIACRR